MQIKGIFVFKPYQTGGEPAGNKKEDSIPFITKSAICSGAASTILLHTHPSGDPTPSREDVELTKRVVEAGKLIGISCVDHVIVGCGTGHTFSIREQERSILTRHIAALQRKAL